MASIQFGILLFPFQLSDCAMPLDIIFSSTKRALASMEGAGFPAGISERGIPEIQFHYIAATSLDPVRLYTAGFTTLPTTTVADCPKLDYLLIGGPETSYIQNLPSEVSRFLQERVTEVTTIFTTCTGAMVLAAAGVLDGIEATTNHGAVPLAQQLLPKVKWTREKQWVVSEGGKFWTAGGACAGMDMFAHWVMGKYGVDVATYAFAALDYSPRGQDKQLVQLPSVKWTA
ncbi:hypothetical protein A1O3_08457 [Capronia epimyces CBS 606.96]|uniref:DJ-1/PfpI domain-containing protein n=1 Tax=Capronia epimyces CBS 606.96 TaxID=1182542 RepID=W9XEN9_9EURO|nr:uncharacterized protein A1O3_08457 [Capronia epimyces CBS 606.96]EXJ78957.1 hypothetical protein A1O3_08457 [Capronia epimyces CBS 606.96]